MRLEHFLATLGKKKIPSWKSSFICVVAHHKCTAKLGLLVNNQYFNLVLVNTVYCYNSKRGLGPIIGPPYSAADNKAVDLLI